MFKNISKIIPALFLWGILIVVVLQIPYPESITQANFAQLILFFIPLFLSLIFTINIFLRNIFSAASISLGLIFLLFLKALDSLNLVTAVLIVIATALFISYFRKIKRGSLTKLPKIPKLHAIQRKKQ